MIEIIIPCEIAKLLSLYVTHPLHKTPLAKPCGVSTARHRSADPGNGWLRRYTPSHSDLTINIGRDELTFSFVPFANHTPL